MAVWMCRVFWTLWNENFSLRLFPFFAMALEIINSGITGCATHALVIGVGAYHHMSGGCGGRAAEDWGLEQLDCPALSAQHFMEWLRKDYQNTEAPLATIEYLISAPGTAPGGLDDPSMDNLYAAFRDWRQRADTDAGNIALFYFCGHGLYRWGRDFNSRDTTVLLAGDFADPAVPRVAMNAIDIGATINIMRACRAERQCYFVDCCRTTDATWEDMMDMPGQPLGSAQRQNLHPSRQPVFYAVGPTLPAEAIGSEVSVFTSALVKALRDLAVWNPEGDFVNGRWVIQTGLIEAAVNHAISIELLEKDWLSGSRCFSGGGGSFDLHTLQGRPKIPLLTACDPAVWNGQATFTLHKNGNEIARRAPMTGPWLSYHYPDMYDLQVALPNGSSDKKVLYLIPPFAQPQFRIPLPPRV